MKSKLLKITIPTLMLLAGVAACRLKSTLTESADSATVEAIPFAKAGGEDPVGLARVHAESFSSAPAAIRPDPDLYARRLLKQFRPDGNTMARQLGLVEQYRLMLGGASDDFRTVPQDTYDATSLLTLQKVAQEICTALVAPNSWSQPGWSTILPEPPARIEANIRSLMKKFLGVSENSLDSSAVAELIDMVNAEAVKGVIANESYVTACTAIAMDAEALLL
ncbi:hypothetical protein EBR21_04740 [bacterium]|nr:hypothetical protein [bacterium]